LLKGKKAFGCKWVFEKNQGSLDGDIIHYKARLVAKDYAKREGIDYYEVFSHIVKHSSIRILLALAVQYKLELDQLDLKTAFLYGDLDEEIFYVSAYGVQYYRKREYSVQVEEIALWAKIIAKTVIQEF